MQSAAFSQQSPARFDLISEFDHSAANAREDGFDYDFIVVECRREIPAIGFRNSQERLFFAFHLAIAEPTFAAEIAAAHLHPNQIVRVVDHSHLIGFGITHADAALGLHAVILLYA